MNLTQGSFSDSIIFFEAHGKINVGIFVHENPSRSAMAKYCVFTCV